MSLLSHFLHLLFLLLAVTSAFAQNSTEEHDHGFELAVAVDVSEADVLTIVVEKEAHGDEDEDDGHGHDDRRLSGEGEEEPEYPFDHNVVLVQMFSGACTEESIEDIEETVEEILENETSIYTEVESGEAPVNVTQGHGLLQLELHPQVLSPISLFHFSLAETGCVVMFFEHSMESGFLRDSHGDVLQPSFQEPALAAASFDYSAEIWVTAIGATVLVCLLSLTGALLLICGFKNGAGFFLDYEQEIMALVFGVLLAVTIIHLLPEASEFYGPLDYQFGLAVLGSIFAGFLVKMAFGHDHVSGASETQILEAAEKQEGGGEVMEVKGRSRAWNIIWGDLFHNLSDGVLIATAFGACASDNTLGWIVTGSIVLHEIPQELADFTILYHDFDSAAIALGFNLLSSLSALLGAILVLSLGFIEAKDQAILLAINIGVLLFITLGEIAPHITETSSNSRRAVRVLIAVVGFVIIGLIELAPHNHCEVSASGLAEVHGHE